MEPKTYLVVQTKLISSCNTEEWYTHMEYSDASDNTIASARKMIEDSQDPQRYRIIKREVKDTVL